MKFVSLVLFLSVALVFGERQVEETNPGLLQYDSPEVKEMHTKCGTLVAEHKGLYNDFSTFTSTADTSTEPFLPMTRTNLRHREVADVKTMHKKFGNLDLPFSLPLTLAPNFGKTFNTVLLPSNRSCSDPCCYSYLLHPKQSSLASMGLTTCNLLDSAASAFPSAMAWRRSTTAATTSAPTRAPAPPAP